MHLVCVTVTIWSCDNGRLVCVGTDLIQEKEDIAHHVAAAGTMTTALSESECVATALLHTLYLSLHYISERSHLNICRRKMGRIYSCNYHYIPFLPSPCSYFFSLSFILLLSFFLSIPLSTYTCVSTGNQFVAEAIRSSKSPP